MQSHQEHRTIPQPRHLTNAEVDRLRRAWHRNYRGDNASILDTKITWQHIPPSLAAARRRGDRITWAVLGVLVLALLIALIAGTYLDARPAYAAANVDPLPLVEVEPAITPTTIPAIIIDAAVTYDIAPATMLRISWCESRHNPAARSPGGHAGLFQFAASTWAYASHRAGFGGWSPFNPYANAHAAAWLYRAEGPTHWTCK